MKRVMPPLAIAGQKQAVKKPAKKLSKTAQKAAQAEQKVARAAARATRALELQVDQLKKRDPELWRAARRILRLVGIQRRCAAGQFPPGHCFVYAGLPGTHSFCVKQIVEMDFVTALVAMEVHPDDEMEEGTVLIPMEAVAWFGFPAHAVPTGHNSLGFAIAPTDSALGTTVLHSPGAIKTGGPKSG